MIEELISAGRYEDALSLIKDTKDEHQVYLKIICLQALKRYNEARIECEILKEYAEKNYYDVIAIYVSILIDMDSLEDAKQILEEELSMPYIPGKYEKIFNETYDELLKRGRENSKSINMFDTLSDEDLAHELLISQDKEITYMLLEQLEQRNIRRLIPALEDFLKDVNKSRIFKTIILESLAAQNVNQDFQLVDKGITIKVNPIDCTPVMELDSIKKIIAFIEEEIDNKDISFIQYCGEVLMSYVGNVYPINISPSEYNLVGTSIIIYVESLVGNSFNYGDKLIEKYHLDENLIEEKLELLEKIMIL